MVVLAVEAQEAVPGLEVLELLDKVMLVERLVQHLEFLGLEAEAAALEQLE
jgi:hypothetical protein